jgi:hypothetical protein
LKTFLLERATQNEIVALSLYWYVKVEVKDTKTLVHSTSSSGIKTISAGTSSNNITSNLSDQSGGGGGSGTANPSNNDQSSKSNFQMFMDELLENLRNVSSNSNFRKLFK